jgi:hypothetical protein
VLTNAQPDNMSRVETACFNVKLTSMRISPLVYVNNVQITVPNVKATPFRVQNVVII